MGDRYYIPTKCPKCGAEYYIYDAPSCMQWCNKCDECGWTDGLDYYETDRNTIELLTEEEAKDKGV